MTGSNINPNGTRDTAFTRFCWKVLQKSFNWPHTSVLNMWDEKKLARILVLVIGLRVMNSHIVICTWMTLFLVILSFLGIGRWKWLQTVIMTLVVIMSTNANQFLKALGVSFKMRYHFLQTDIMGLTDGPSSKPPHFGCFGGWIESPKSSFLAQYTLKCASHVVQMLQTPPLGHGWKVWVGGHMLSHG